MYEHPLARRTDARRVRILWEGASRRTSYSGVIWDGELRVRHGDAAFGPVTRLRFDSPRSHVAEHSGTRLRWHSVTCGYRSGLVVELLGGADLEAECRVRTALITRPAYGGHGDRGPTRMSYAPAEAVAFRFAPDDVAARPRPSTWARSTGGSPSRTPPPRGIPTPRASRSSIRRPRPGLNPYWVRVVQEDQEMAWSSPIFVDYVAPAPP